MMNRKPTIGMKLLSMLLRRWRVTLWIYLIIVIIFILCTAVLIYMPGSKVGRSKPPSSEDASHLQVTRKRLNKSVGISNSLKYVEENKDDGFDPVPPRNNLRGRIIEKFMESRSEVTEGDAETVADGGNSSLGAEDDIRNPNKNAVVRGDNNVGGTGQRGVSYRVRIPNQGHGGRANYSIPEVDEFVEKFQSYYQSSSLYAINHDIRYHQFQKNLHLYKKKGSRLQAYVNNEGKRSWEKFYHGIHQHYLYDPTDLAIDKLMNDLLVKDIVNVDLKEGGTQIKLTIAFEDEGQGLFKPRRFPWKQETLPDHFYFNDFERHNAEIAAFFLDRALGFHRVPPTIGRLMNVSKLYAISTIRLRVTFFISPAGNLCFYGFCRTYCASNYPICGHPEMLEGSLAAFLPPSKIVKRKKWRNPWKRSYHRKNKAYWEVHDDLCTKVKAKHPYNEGRRLLDILDMSVFDFLTGNLDRHHYETFREFDNDTFLLHLDNGRAFGKSKYDCMSCLAPVIQCCMVRLSTLAKLVKFYDGPDSLSKVMRGSLATDSLNPVLTEGHLDALDRRVSKILLVINGCLKGGKPWNEVIVDDGVT